MPTRAALPAAALALLAACAEPAPQAAGWSGGPITTAAVFEREIVGRPLTTETADYAAALTIDADGTWNSIVRSPDGETVLNELAGVWRWEDGRFCRDVTEGETRLPRSECQRISKAGDRMTFVAPNGRSGTLTVGDA